MNSKILTIILLLLMAAGATLAKGHLVIIGGGSRSEAMINKIIELAGGDESKLLIIPNASSKPVETAEYQMKQFMDCGAVQVDILYCDWETADTDSNSRKLDDVSGIFFSGGDQSRLTEALIGTNLLSGIRGIYENGGVIAGTSAGAAVMSEIMITGDENLHPDSKTAFAYIQQDNIETIDGFGFIKNAIIDQHFVARKRHNRLISLVLENPDNLGIGIDESTAIIVYPNDVFEVLGSYSVIVYDAYRAKSIKSDQSGNLGAYNLKMHILLAGDKFNMKKRKVIK